MPDEITSVIINTLIALFLFGLWMFGIWAVYRDTTRRCREDDLTTLQQGIWIFLSLFLILGPLAYLFLRQRTASRITNWLPKNNRTDSADYEAKTNLPDSNPNYNEPVTSVWSGVVDETIFNRTDRETKIPEDMQQAGLFVQILDGPGRLVNGANLHTGRNILGAVPPQTGHFIMIDEDNTVSGQHVLVEVASAMTDIWVTNLSQRSRTEVNGRPLATSERIKTEVGVTLKLGYTTLTLTISRQASTIANSQTASPVYSDEYNFSARNSKYSLRVRRGANLGYLFPITSSPFVIGRDEASCHLMLTNDPTVSRNHAKLVQNGSNLHIENISQYGTIVNNNPIMIKKLSAGDEIQVGETVLIVEVTK